MIDPAALTCTDMILVFKISIKRYMAVTTSSIDIPTDLFENKTLHPIDVVQVIYSVTHTSQFF